MNTPLAPLARSCGLALSLALAATVALAQTTAVSPATEKQPTGDTIQLEKFTVTTALDRYSDTMSSAAMKTPVAQTDLAFTVQVLNSAFLNDVRASRLEDAFGYVIGLNKQGPAINQFTLRGFSAAGSNIQSVQVDGLAGPTSRFASPPAINVDRMEVLKGPTSVLYGQNNPGGMINVITKSPQATRRTTLSTFVSTYEGQTSGFGDAFSYTASVDSTGAIDDAKRWLYRLIVSYEDQGSFRDFYYQKNKYFYPSLTYRWNADSFLTLKGDYAREDRQANDGLAVPLLDASLLPPINVSYDAPDGIDTDYGEYLTTSFQTRLMDRWTVRANYRTTYHTDSRRAYEHAQQAIVSNNNNYLLSTIGRRLRFQDNVKRFNFLDANVFGDFGQEKFRHTVIAGVNGGKEYLDTDTIAQGGTIPAIPAVNLYTSVPDVAAAATYPTVFTAAGLNAQRRRQTDFWNYGYYVSDQISIGKLFDASLGLRHDKQDSYQKTTARSTGAQSGLKQSASKTLPSAGLVFHPTSEISLYASYCEGFKPQAPGNVDINDNPNFPPETSTQVEFGLKFDALNHRLNGGVSVYDIKKKNVLTATGTTSPTGSPISNLSGLQEAKGIEVSVTYLPRPNWQIQTGYTYIDATVKTSTTVTLPGALLDNTPKHSGNLFTRYNLPEGRFKGLGLSLGVIYAGERQAIITNVARTVTVNPTTGIATVTGPLALPGYTRVDAGLYYRQGRFDYALNFGNVFDETYIAGAIPADATRLSPGEPRKITLSIKFDL